MLRVIFVFLFVIHATCPSSAADRNEMFQAFSGMIQQFQQLGEQERQRKAYERQQRLVWIDQTLRTCMTPDETACMQIIEAEGMPPYANYTAFTIVGDIELKRGDTTAARRSYQYALRWAMKMQDRERATNAIRSRLSALNVAPAPPTETTPRPSSVVVSNPDSLRQVPATDNGPPKRVASASPADVVCDASGSVKWKIACLQASQAADGAKLYAQLSETLRQYQTTLNELLGCEAALEKDSAAGMKCFEGKGLSGEALRSVRLAALEYNLLIEARLEKKH